MIQPNELRIGNRYNHTKAGVITLDGEWISYFAKFPELLSGIELSEDWLKRFGFEKNEYSVQGVQYSEPFFHINLESKGWLVRWIDTLSTWALHPKVSDYNVVPVKYVHQLQNLYHSLTGEELTLSE